MSEYITDPALLAQLNGTTSDGYVTDPALLEQLNKKSFKERARDEVRSVSDQGLTGVTDVVNRGLVGGILGMPVDLVNLALNAGRAGVGYAGHKMGLLSADQMPEIVERPVGGSEWMGQKMQNWGMVSPERRPILEATAGLLPIAPSAVKGAYNLSKAAVNVPIDVAKGALLNKPGTSLVTIEGNQIYKPEAVDRYMKGYLTKAELQAPENMMPLTKAQQAAVKLSGDQVPTRGKVAEATGERLYQDYTNPIKLLTDIGTTALTGVPFHTAKRVGQAAIDSALSKNLKLDPAFKAKFEADVGGAIPPGGSGGAPTWASPVTPPKVPPTGPAVPPTGPAVPPTGPAVPPAVNYNTPAYQRQGRQIPGVNAPQTPAQANATAMGISPPMTAEQSGFTQQLNNLAKGPAVPEAAPKIAPITEMPTPIKQLPVPKAETPAVTTGPAVPEAPVNTPTMAPKVKTPPIDKVFGGREGRPLTIKAADEFKAAQTENPYTVWYKKGGQVVEETGNRTIKFKANPDFEITNTMRYKGNNPKNPYSDEMTGVIKSTGEPIKIKLANDPKAEEYVKVFKINNGKEQLHQVYTSNGTLISSPGTKGTSPKPGTMSMMEDSDKSKFFNKIKASGEAPLEQSVAKMSQADRNRMEQTLRSEINEKNRNTIQPFLDVFEKYRTIK